MILVNQNATQRVVTGLLRNFAMLALALPLLVQALLLPTTPPALHRSRTWQRTGALTMSSDWVESTVFFEKPMSHKFMTPLTANQFLLASDETVSTHAGVIYEQLLVQAASIRRSPMSVSHPALPVPAPCRYRRPVTLVSTISQRAYARLYTPVPSSATRLIGRTFLLSAGRGDSLIGRCWRVTR